MGGKLSNSDPLIKSIELLKQEARILNAVYRPQVSSIQFNDVEIVGLPEVAGNKIDVSKFCTAELGSRYIDLFIGNEREPKTTGDIIEEMEKITYADAQVIKGGTSPGRALIFVSSNIETKGDVQKEAEGNPVRIKFSSPIFSREGVSFQQYTCGTYFPPEIPGQVGSIRVGPNPLDRKPTAKSIEKFNKPGATLFSHRFDVDNKGFTGMNFSLIDADVLHAFLNGLPTLELSRAVTFFRASFYSPAIQKKTKSGNQSSPPVTLASFLGLDTGTLQRTYGSPSAADLTRLAVGYSPFLKEKTLSRTGFELFLGPQTLVNPDINRSPPGTFSNRNFPVLDPMVPLASIDSFRITIQNSPVAAFTTQVAELKIIVHDKSRLEELSSIIAIQDFPSNFIEIEYGYNHPDSDPVRGSAAGRFINLMKMRQVFTVAGYAMNVKDRSVEVNLRLVSLTDRALSAVPCITGNFIPIRAVTQYLENLSKATFSSVLGKEVLQFDPKSTAGLMVPRSNFVELVNAIKSIGTIEDNQTGEPVINEEIDQAVENLRTAIETNTQRSENTNPAAEQTRIIDSCKAFNIGGTQGSDPFFEELAGANKESIRQPLKSGNFCTAAQLISRLVLYPLASSTIFDEVQIHTFSFNERAAKLSKLPIAMCPIDVDLFARSLTKTTNPNRIYTTAEMLGKIVKFCSNPYNIAFGVSDQFKKIKDARDAAEKARKEEESEEGEEEGPPPPTPAEKTARSALTDRLKLIYKEVYGTDATNDEAVFKVPRVRSEVQSLKKQIEDEDGVREINICKIIIYDEACSSIGDLSSILGVAAEEMVSNPGTKSAEFNLNKAKDIRVVREILSRLYPVLTPGTGNSVVSSVSVATSTSGQAAQVQLIESLKGVYGAEQDSMPDSAGSDIEVIPAKISFTSIGCPIISRGQSVFVNLKTGTTLDNVYSVSSVSHSIDSRGSFTTSVSLAPTSSGTVRGVSTKIERAIKQFVDSKSYGIEDR